VKKLLLTLFLISTNLFSQNVMMVNPSNNIGIDKWRVVNDGVMGGISQSNIYLNEVSNIIFAGNVSLENNGGFASIRMGYDGSQLKETTKFLLRVKGDGNIYKFRLNMSGSYANYSADFKTVKDQWMDIEIPIESFKPYYFGRSTRAPKLKVHRVNSLGILISDKQAGNFALEIEYIIAFKVVSNN
jgi:monofunctional biosynthetic peptidoglycan transglycosylase|tara:strand:- start:15013 stop:15570 length:558 start_codon:yes stop_codon:yes gene_type:complete